MNQYWAVALFFSYLGVGLMGIKYGADEARLQCTQREEQEQQHVIGQMVTQNNITQETSNAYHSGITAIDSLYSAAGVQPTDNGNIRRVSTPACGTQASKKYKLTLKQCDDEEFKCIALWNWTQQQAAVK